MKTRWIMILAASALGFACIGVFAQQPARIYHGGFSEQTPGAALSLASALMPIAQDRTASAPCLIRHQDGAWKMDERILRVAMTCDSSATISPDYPLTSNSGIQINSAVLTWSSEVQNLPQSRLINPNASLADCGRMQAFSGIGGNSDCGRLLEDLEIPPLNGSLQPGARTYIF